MRSLVIGRDEKIELMRASVSIPEEHLSDKDLAPSVIEQAQEKICRLLAEKLMEFITYDEDSSADTQHTILIGTIKLIIRRSDG